MAKHKVGYISIPVNFMKKMDRNQVIDLINLLVCCCCFLSYSCFSEDSWRGDMNNLQLVLVGSTGYVKAGQGTHRTDSYASRWQSQ